MLILDQIYCMDNLIGCKFLDDNSVDLTVTSPPYDDLRTYKGSVWNFEKLAKELYRVTKLGGVVVWVVGDSTVHGDETGTSFKQALFFKSIGFKLHDTMIYEKNGPNYPSKNRYYSIFEYMFVFSKGIPKTFNPLQDRKNRWFGQKWSKIRTRKQKNGEVTRETWIESQGQEYGTRFNIWRYNVGHKYTASDLLATKHPAPFPEALAQDHILSWSNKGDLILDPFVGSGTTAKMAMLNGRHYIGFDSSQEYCDDAENRIETAIYGEWITIERDAK